LVSRWAVGIARAGAVGVGVLVVVAGWRAGVAAFVDFVAAFFADFFVVAIESSRKRTADSTMQPHLT
jgi:hypothetical protein